MNTLQCLIINEHATMNTLMDMRACNIVADYIDEHLDKSDSKVSYDVYVVWKCKTLQNWKFLVSSTLIDGMYYEVTYNGDKDEWYLDAYKKFENRCIGGDDICRKTEVGHDN